MKDINDGSSHWHIVVIGILMDDVGKVFLRFSFIGM